MNLVDPKAGAPIPGIAVPVELYWVLSSPTPLAGMKYPRSSFPWAALAAAGFSDIVSLHPAAYDPTPLRISFSEQLEDLAGGGPPQNDAAEKARIKRAVTATLLAWRAGLGTVVHCVGGRGRTGTVLGCALRELGFGASEAVAFLDRVHRARGKPGWPESIWQSTLVNEWTAIPSRDEPLPP
jgi:hypothetical protein